MPFRLERDSLIWLQAARRGHILAEAGMARQTGRAALVLSGEHRSLLSDLAGSRTAAQREVQPLVW